MKYKLLIFLIFSFLNLNSQTINLNESHIIDYFRFSQLDGTLNSNFSFTLKPFDIVKSGLKVNSSFFNIEEYAPTISNFFNGKGKFKILPLDFNIEYSSNHPYNRNNGSMIPNTGYQHIVSLGFYTEIGPLSIQFKPEHLFSQNKDFEGFGEGPNGHYDIIWAKRYRLWNKIDMPERFGEKQHNKMLIGQSSIRLNFKGLSFGLSNENIWWGPSKRNSIMMSNHASGFKHITFNTLKPLKTLLGYIEWQFITGRLESSGFTPPNTEKTYAGTRLYVPKINQMGRSNDWRYLQGISITYSPKWINGLSLGFNRWVQMYSALVKGKYTWMDGKPTYFPLFNNIFRKNDKYSDYEAQVDQAAGVFLRWLWADSKAEIYAEFHYNDSKYNVRDLLADSDHSRAVTVGLQKIFKINGDNFLFSWEWTEMAQTESRLLRNSNSWYEHWYVFDGYTNKGEVLGASIGPGSNSHHFSLNRIKKTEKIGIALEIVDQDKDFFHSAFSSAQDFIRNWKDFNFHLNYSKKFNKFWLSSNLIYSENLNYQWDIDDSIPTYYHAGNDQNNFHLNFKLTYLLPL